MAELDADVYGRIQTLCTEGDSLAKTDDYITLGNIQSSYGRMYRREGRYDLALRHFANAIDEYSKRDPEHRNLARSLANMGYVERLIALQLRKKIDADAAQRRRSEPELRRDYESTRAQALAHLDRASQIYEIHSNHRGAGTVCKMISSGRAIVVRVLMRATLFRPRDHDGVGRNHGIRAEHI